MNMSAHAQRVLLTGGAGFIGSHVATALLDRGIEVTILDNLDSFYLPAWKRDNLAEIRAAGEYGFVEADICDEEALGIVFARTRPDAVIHLAARAGVRPSIEQPLLYERVNVQGTLNLLDLCRKHNVTKFVFGSSSSVYGATNRAPFREDQIDLRPISPYAATKLAGEMICYTYSHLYKLPIVCLRFFTVYGPRQRPDLAIFKFTALLERGKPIPIFGDGSTGRDYTYVDDIVAGVLAALNINLETASSAPFDIFNLGNSQPVTLSQLVKLLETVTCREAIREFKPLQPGDVPLTWADISKASRLLGYRPLVSLDEGLKRFVSWYREAAPKRQHVSQS